MLKSPMWELLSQTEGDDKAILFHIPDKCSTTHAPICQMSVEESNQTIRKNKENEGDSSNQIDLDSQALLQPFGPENSEKMEMWQNSPCGN
jgi:hypothetical protein